MKIWYESWNLTVYRSMKKFQTDLNENIRWNEKLLQSQLFNWLLLNYKCTTANQSVSSSQYVYFTGEVLIENTEIRS